MLRRLDRGWNFLVIGSTETPQQADSGHLSNRI